MSKLDEAWATAETALPDGWDTIGVDSLGSYHRDIDSPSTDPNDRYRAYAWPPIGVKYDAGNPWFEQWIVGFGPTPATALLALAERLRVHAATKV